MRTVEEEIEYAILTSREQGREALVDGAPEVHAHLLERAKVIKVADGKTTYEGSDGTWWIVVVDFV